MTCPNAEPGEAQTPRRMFGISAASASTDAGAVTASPQPSLSKRVSAATAASASSPSALTCTLSPWTVCNAMIATRDLPLACACGLCRWMVAENALAAWANTAAGRACRPLGLGRLIGCENTASPGTGAGCSPTAAPTTTSSTGWPTSTNPVEPTSESNGSPLTTSIKVNKLRACRAM